MDPFIGEIRIFPFTFAPVGWAFCNGQILPIVQNTALFSILGTTYGGDGKTNFALPNLQGRVPMHWGAGSGLTPRNLGNSGGSTTAPLTTAQMPSHNHGLVASTVASNDFRPEGKVIARPFGRGNNLYSKATQPLVPMDPSAVTATGGSQPHNNMQPYLPLNFCIAMQGLYPPRS